MADVVLQLTIPDANVERILTALNKLAGKPLSIEATDSDWWRGIWQYSFEPKTVDETNKDFAVRVIKENIKAMVRMVEYAQDVERYKTIVATVSPPTQTVPDNIIM